NAPRPPATTNRNTMCSCTAFDTSMHEPLAATKDPPSTGTEGHAFRGTTLILPRRSGGTLGGAITGASPSPVWAGEAPERVRAWLPACTVRRLSARELRYYSPSRPSYSVVEGDWWS